MAAAIAALLASAVARRRLSPLLWAAFVALAVGTFGAVRLGRPMRPGREVAVALLQPNLTEEGRGTLEGAQARYATVIAQAQEAAEGRPELIVIPESSLPAYWNRSAALRGDLTALTETGASILFNDVDELADGRYFNAARLLSPEGLVQPPYHKVHLVPFGEYVPLPKLFFFARRISQAIGEFTPAPSPTLIRSGPLSIGMGICYEIIYPSLARREVAGGANLLATISNDSWYGRAGAQQQHFAGATLRTVENERFLLRAAITGVSGIVDARGRILAETPPDQKATLTGTVRLQDGRTAWTRWGFWIPVVADAFALAVLLCGVARWARERPRPTPSP